jgi:hypothetical protein
MRFDQAIVHLEDSLRSLRSFPWDLDEAYASDELSANIDENATFRILIQKFNLASSVVCSSTIRVIDATAIWDASENEQSV